ncbi:MAG: hypothetical protein LBM71_04780 [Elusimicrobiota bacterium]|jgi:tetratricopeptide (TPR) repeat protein|nr:hypothetical protein [Elusimicrobiota bacterium]
MKKLLLSFTLITVTFFAFAADRPMREHGKEPGMILDLQKISLGTISNVEQKKQYLSTIQLEKQRIQNYTLRMVYENAYALYRRGDYQRAQELANVILSIDPTLTKAQTLATEAGRMATYGTISEQEIINMKYSEGENLYKSGRLVSAQNKFEEILVLRPYETRAKEWLKTIDDEIADQHIRRGYYAYKNGDYKEALDQWYSVLLIKKEDKDLTAKIAEVEDLMKKEENKKVLNKAFSLYSQGKLLGAYKEFERSLEIQPGEQQTQKYAMQLKEEIAKGYFTSGTKAYNAKKYTTAINNFKAAKNWGYNQNDVNNMIKNAEKAKSAPITEVKQPAPAPAEPIAPAPVVPAPVDGPTPQPITDAPTDGFPTGVLTQQQGGIVTEEARQASIERYKNGIVFFNDANYEKAREEFQAALQLNPENSDAAQGIKRIDAQYSNR